MIRHAAFVTCYTFEKDIVSFTEASASLCECVSVTKIVTRWLNLATQFYVSLLPFYNSSRMQHYQDNRDHRDHTHKHTFWPITSKLMDGFTQNLKSLYIALLGGDNIICILFFQDLLINWDLIISAVPLSMILNWYKFPSHTGNTFFLLYRHYFLKILMV